MIIFPAYAGLNLKVAIPAVVTFNIPRIRGVEPSALTDSIVEAIYSPHTRG